MANQDDGSSLAPYPSPPSYLWREFTEDKAKLLKKLREAYQSNTGTTLTHASIVPSIPEALGLEFLQPPPPPAGGKWRLFGQAYDLSDRLPSLEEQGVPRLGTTLPTSSAEKDTHANKVFELKKMSKSLLLNFLELVGVLGINPADAADKLADLQTIFYNMHQHINEWRPHQTREALITLLQGQLEQKQNETRALHEATENVRKTLVGLGSIEDAGQTNGAGKAEVANGISEKGVGLEESRSDEVWAALDERFG